jgi:hypothetical protein
MTAEGRPWLEKHLALRESLFHVFTSFSAGTKDGPTKDAQITVNARYALTSLDPIPEALVLC